MKIKDLTKVLLAGAIVASTLLPNKLNAQTPTWYDAFNPRNEVVDGFGSYGSGDVDQDGDVDSNDRTTMNTTQNFYSDVDADGTQSTAQDKQVLDEYLNGNREYMPAEYWRSTPSEKDSWIRKVYPIITRLNNREFIPPSDPRAQDPETRFDCTNGVIQDILSMNGYNSNRDDFGLIHSKYTLEYNGLFNLPAYFAGVHSDDGTFNHAVTAIFTKTNLNDLDGWLFLESMTGEVVEPGSLSIPYNSEIKIKGLHNFKDAYNAGLIDQPFLWPAVKLYIDGSGNREMIYMEPNMIEDQASLSVKDNENINISDSYLLKQNFPNPFNSSTTIQFDIPPACAEASADRLNPPSKGDSNVETRHALSLQLIVYDITGKEITTLANNINTSGSYNVKWNASGYPSGLYIYQLQSNSGVIATRKMLLMK